MHRAFMGILAAMALAALACAPAQQAPSSPAASGGSKPEAAAPKAAEPAKPAAQPAKPAAGVPAWVSDAQVYEAAKKEGAVSYFCSLPQTHCEHIGKRFEELTGIKVDVTRLSSGPQWDRIMRERQAGIKAVDVTENGLVPAFSDAKTRGDLVGYLPKVIQEKYDQRFWDKDGAFNAYYTNVQFIAYNPKIIQKADAPKAWKDIYDPKWKGKLSIGHPNYSGIVNDWLLWQTKLYGWEILQKLKANDPFIVRSLVEGIPVLLNGERPLSAESYSDPAWEAKLKGQSIEIVFPEEGMVVSNNPTAILKDSPHPNAAKVFVDYLFSLDNAQWLAEQYIYVTHPDVKFPPTLAEFKPLKDVKTLVTDPAELTRELKTIRERFADTFG